MRLIGYGASPLPPATIREAMAAFKRPFLQMFGTTELMGMSMMLMPSDHERRPGLAAGDPGLRRQAAAVRRRADRRR